MTFDELLRASRSEGEITIPESWAQGRASFGGLVAALAFDHMQRQVASGRPMRSLQVSFVGPVVPGQPFRLESELLREGKSASLTQGRIMQGDQCCLVATASFGAGRASEVSIAGIEAPEVKTAEEATAMPRIEGLTPAFLQYLDLRFALGQVPFTGSDSREMGGWMRFADAPDTITDAHLVALVDAWPPAVLPLLSRPAPASTLNWSLDIMHPRPDIGPGDWLLYRAFIDQADAGYGHTQAAVWTQSGELVALSRQTVTVFG